MLVWAIPYSSPTQFWELCIHTFHPNSHIPGSKPSIQIFFPAFNINFGFQSYPSRVEDPLWSPFRGAGAEEVSGRDSRQAASWSQGEGIIHRITDVTDKKNLQKHISLIHPTLQCRPFSKSIWHIPIWFQRIYHYQQICTECAVCALCCPNHERRKRRGTLPLERALTMGDKFASHIHCLSQSKYLSLCLDTENLHTPEHHACT